MFLNLRKDHPDGILQRFLEAKSRHNCQIQAIWSPRVTMVRRRSNKATLDDKLLTPYERCVTFDGPSHYSEDKLCALPSQEHIKQLCLSFVEHFHSTDHKTITRMVLFFKVCICKRQGARGGASDEAGEGEGAITPRPAHTPYPPGLGPRALPQSPLSLHDSDLYFHSLGPSVL